MPYHFPETKFVTNSIFKQLWVIAGEVFEVAKAMIEGNFNHACVECYDVIQATETLIRIFETKHEIRVSLAKARMITKNYQRGYYEKSSS